MKLVSILKYSFIAGNTLVWSVTFTKISMACMLLRLQQGKAWKWAMLTAIFVLLAIAIIFTGFQFSECTPISASWNLALDPSLAEKCMQEIKAIDAALSTSGILYRPSYSHLTFTY